MSHEAAVAVLACRNCGTSLTGAFCHACGEPIPHDHEFQWKHFVHDAVHEFLHLDGKIFRTLWLLLRRPGLLTHEYWAGRRTSYIRPLRIYIFIAAIHLFAVSHMLYRLDLFKAFDGSSNMERMVNGIARRTNQSPAQVEAAINSKMTAGYSVLQYSAVLAFAVAPWGLYRRRRPYYIQHLIFSLHVYSFYYLFVSAVSPFLTPSAWVRSPFVLVTLAYLFFALRLLYAERWYTTLWKALVLRLALLFAEFVVIGGSLTFAIALAARSY